MRLKGETAEANYDRCHLSFLNISAIQPAKLSQYLRFTHLKYFNGVLK
jgi:hypothetical protein